MGIERKERRRFERVLFSKDDDILGVFLPSRTGGKPVQIIANIMNLSPGGLQFALEKKDAAGIMKDDSLTLKEIRNCKSLDLCSGIEMEVKWVLDMPYLNHIGVGCEFQDLPGTVKRQISQFVDSELECRGQKT